MKRRHVVETACFGLFLATTVWAGGAHATDWSGPYVGANVGYSFDGGGQQQGSLIYPPPATPGYSGAWSGDTDFSGVLGGLLLGYTTALSGGLLIGVEADVQGADVNNSGKLSGTGVSPPFIGVPHTPEIYADQTVNLFGTLRGRIGFAPTGVPDTIVYATGGLAWGHVVNHVRIDDNFAGLSTITRGEASNDELAFGWTAGGGVEFKPQFLSGWHVKAEYLFVDLGDSNLSLLGNTHIGLVTNPWVGNDLTTIRFEVIRLGVTHPF